MSVTGTKNQAIANLMPSAVTVSIPVGSYEITKTSEGDELSVAQYGCLSIPGEPRMPAKIFSIAIPPGAEAQEVTYETKNGILLPGLYRITSCPIPYLMGEQDPVFSAREKTSYQENYRSVYGSNALFPPSVCEIVGNGGYRKYNLVDVRVSPCLYHPLLGMVTYYPDITVTVHYSFPKHRASREVVDSLPHTERIAREIILNYDQAQTWYPSATPSGREQFNYVIITLDNLTSAVTPLVDWENLKGHSVAVVTTSWINATYEGYDLAAKIRAFLLEKYPSSAWGIEDVLLVGNRDQLPMRLMAQDIGGGEPETDYYYAELSLPDNESWDKNGNHQYGETYVDPIDYETEVNVGRIPWSDPATVRHICEKSAAYEQNNDTKYKKNILLLGAFYEASTDNAILMEYTSMPGHNPWMAGWNKTRMYEQNFSVYPMDYDLTYDNVKDVWSRGTYGFVDWAGHGSWAESVRLYPTMTDFVNIGTCPHLNDTYPSIIFACACSNADTDYVNLGQEMMKQGAVGFLGANKIAICHLGWGSPQSGSSQTMDYYFTSCCTSMNYTQGAALQWSLHEMYVKYHWNNLNYETFEWGSLWGNPDLTMGPVTTSDPPVIPPVPSGPTHGFVNENYTFSTMTTDPNGDDLFYLFDWGDGSARSWIGPFLSGAVVSASHTWTRNGSYDVTVKAKDVHNVSSNWSDPLIITIVNLSGPTAPIIRGPTQGKTGTRYNYSFNSSDLSCDSLAYYIEWGDGTNSLITGAPGNETITNHTWPQKGSYTIRARAKNCMGLWSDWGSLQISMPLAMVYQEVLMKFFERFPHAFPVLRYVLGRT